jgi:hypothetical protein
MAENTFERFLRSRGRSPEESRPEKNPVVEEALKRFAATHERGDPAAMKEAGDAIIAIEKEIGEELKKIAPEGVSSDPVVAARRAGAASAEALKNFAEKMAERGRQLEEIRSKYGPRLSGHARSTLAFLQSTIGSVRQVASALGKKEELPSPSEEKRYEPRFDAPEPSLRNLPDEKAARLLAVQEKAAAGRLPVEAAPMKKGDPFYERLADLETDPATVDRLSDAVTDSLRNVDLKDRAIRQELRQMQNMLGEVRRRLSATDNEQVQAWATEVLDHIDNPEAADPLLMIAEENPFRLFAALKDTPHLQSIISGAMENAAKAKSPEEIARFRGAVDGAVFAATAAGVFAITYVSFGVASGGFQNMLLVLAPKIPGIEYLGALMEKMGVRNVRDVGFEATKFMGLVASFAATLTFSHYRAQKTKFLGKPLRFYVALWFAALSAASNIVERISEATQAAQLGGDMVKAFGSVVDRVQNIQPALLGAERSFTRSGLEAAAKEAESGFGPKTMLKLAVIGLLNRESVANLNAEFVESLPKNLQEFLRKNPQVEFEAFLTTGSGKTNPKRYRDEWTGYQNAIAKVATEPKYAALGFGRTPESDQLLQVLQRLFSDITKAPVDGVTPIAAFERAREMGKNAEGTNMWDQLATTSHIPLSWINTAITPFTDFRVREAPALFQMIGQRDLVIRKLKGQIATYDQLRGPQARLVSSFLDDIALNTGVSEIRNLRSLLEFRSLGITTKDIDDISARIVSPEVRLAIQILFFDQDGWRGLSQALQKGGINVDLEQPTPDFMGTGTEIPAWAKQVAYILSVAGFYTAVDLLPKYPVKWTNRSKTRRFDRELGDKYNTINDLEAEIADDLADRINGFYKLASNAIRTKAGGLENVLPHDLLAAHIRRRLREVAAQEPEVAGDTALAQGQGLVLLRKMTDFAFGFDDVPDDVPTFNRYRDWLEKEVRNLRSGDHGLMAVLVGKVYRSFGPGGIALMDTLKHPEGSDEYRRAMRDIERQAREMRLEELRSLVPELESQLELLKRGALELAGRGEGTPEEPVTLWGRGNLKYSMGHINRTYVMTLLQDDIDRYTRSLEMIRREGIQLETEELQENRDAMTALPQSIFRAKEEKRPLVGRFRELFSRKPDETREATRANPVDFSGDQAARDSLVHNMQKRLGFYRKLNAPTNEDEFAAYMNTIDVGLQSALRRFESHVESMNNPILKGRKFILHHEYHPAVQGPTITLNTLGFPIGEGNPEAIAVAPYTDGLIPDLVSQMSPDQAVQRLSAWLEPDGPAMKMLEAQIIAHQMKEFRVRDEEQIRKRYERPRLPIRVPLEPTTISAYLRTDSEGTYANEDLHDLARLRYIKRWLTENRALIANTDRGLEISARTLEALYQTRLPPDATEARAFTRDDETAITNTLRLIQERERSGALKGIDVLYDPKTAPDADIVFRRKKDGFEVRIPVGATAEAVRTALQETHDAPKLPGQFMRRVSSRVPRPRLQRNKKQTPARG